MDRLVRFLPLVVAAASLPWTADPAGAQWTNRYPRVDGYSHHVYLEGYELPTLGTGIHQAAAAPEGDRIAFSSRGWIWVLDVQSQEARRVTWGEEMDFRPAWSPDGERIAFVRDTGSDTSIWIVEVASGQEREVVSTGAIDLDPAFSPDGTSLYYSSATAGDLDLWRLDLDTNEEERLTSERGLELRPLPHPDGDRLVYLAKTRGGGDQIRVRDLVSGREQTLREGRIASQARPALSPDGEVVAVNWPHGDGWELLLMGLDAPVPATRLTGGQGRPLAPAWSADGSRIYFSEADREQRFRLWAIDRVGGEESRVPVHTWRWEEETGRVRIRTASAGGDASAVPARLHVTDGRGHPGVPDHGQPRFDGETGRVFFYSPGVVEVELPVGEAQVLAARRFAGPAAEATVSVVAGETREVDLELETLWDPRDDGWFSGDHHFHLNYGGPYLLEPEDLVLQMRGEDLDLATPLAANLHHRLIDREWAGWQRLGSPPLIRIGQEVRSGFHGHVGLSGISELFWPWVWGPGHEVYGQLDLPNGDALAHTRRHGGVAGYVHPVSGRDPFDGEGRGGIPRSLVPDAVLGDLDALEVACLWTNDLGTSELWYRILNVGVPLAPWAGTDVMTNFYRTMGVGTTRVYVRPDGPLNFPGYLAALRAGRSFVTTGPLLDFRVNGGEAGEARPGDVVDRGTARWSLQLHTPTPVERVELVVNGEVVHEAEGPLSAGSAEYSGEIELPEAGWIAVRAHGGEPEWPAMATEPFAHTAPVWIGEVGSSDPDARARAAAELLTVVEAAEEELREAYGDTSVPRLTERFRRARERLEGWLVESGLND